MKTLPRKAQARIIAYLDEHTLVEGAAWCAKEIGIKTSKSRLGEFRDWYETGARLERVASVADRIRDELARMPELKDAGDAAMKAAQASFEVLAWEMHDPKLYMGLRRLRNSERFLKLERDKFEFDAAKACLKQLPVLRAIAGDKSLDEDAKLRAVRERLFGEIPE